MARPKFLSDEEAYSRRLARHREWYKRNHKHSKLKATESQLRKRYGVTLEDYDIQYSAQGGACAICGTETPGGGNGRFCVDHNHNTGEFRGLLCHSCNRGLGLFKDSPSITSRATEYLVTNGYYGEDKTN